MSTPPPRAPTRKNSPFLWLAWWRAVQLLRPACHRTTTFLWLAVVLAAFCLRPDLAGVTSLVRSLGLKRPKERRKMPGVKSLHQESECNAKAPFIMGHSCQVVAVLVQSAGACLGVPVAARIHEGLVWSNRDRRSLLTKLAQLLLELSWGEAVTVVADAYYAAGKFARRLLDHDHHWVTRVRSSAASQAPPVRSTMTGRSLSAT